MLWLPLSAPPKATLLLMTPVLSIGAYVNISLHQMELYQQRKRQLRELKIDHPICKTEAIEDIAYGATPDAWGALIWHMLHGRKDSRQHLGSGDASEGEGRS